MIIFKEDVESFNWKDRKYKECYICGKKTLFRIRIYDKIHTKYNSMPILKIIPICKKCQEKIKKAKKGG